MRKTSGVLLAIFLVVSLASIGVVAAFSGDGGAAAASDIGAIVASPGDWLGEEVTVEGFVAFSSSKWFALYGNEGPSITVKTTGDTPPKGAVVIVKGTVGVEDFYGSERVYVLARSSE